MKILHIVGNLNPGGSENQATQLVNSLLEKKIGVVMAVLRKEGRLLKHTSCQVKEFRVTSFKNRTFFYQLLKSAKFIRENGFQIIHTHDFYSNVFGAFVAQLAGIKVITSKRETNGIRSKKQDMIEKLVFKFSDTILANSHAVKNYLLQKGLPEDKIFVIHNGVDLTRFDNIEQGKNLYQILGLPRKKDTKFVVHVANFRHKVKNQAMLLRAAKKILESLPNVHFVFAGEGDLIEENKKLAARFGIAENTHFIGGCEAIPELLQTCHIGVLTSYHEGFPNAVLEYMAAGKPVIATNVGGVQEALIEGKTGFLVNPDDDDVFIERLIFLLKNEAYAKKLGLAGRKIVEEKFSLQRQVDKTIQLYKSLLL